MTGEIRSYDCYIRRLAINFWFTAESGIICASYIPNSILIGSSGSCFSRGRLELMHTLCRMVT